MTGFRALVGIFLRDLVRRKMLWAIVALAIAAIAISHWTNRMIAEAVGNGDSWDIATRRAASRLDDLAFSVRSWSFIIAVLFAAQVAPESRRNGTTQFVLSLGVRRDTLAAAQFAALTVIVAAATLVLHVGFAVAGLNTHAIDGREAALAWPTLFVPLLAACAATFALSLTASTIETYLVMLVVPLLTRTLPSLLHGFAHGFPVFVVRATDNVSLFFPQLDQLVLWPHLAYGGSQGEPRPLLTWPVAHAIAAMLFWVVLGVWLHRRHDFGSRTAVK